ncbi:glutamate--tRNA ligase [Phaeovibrio sulfidiphilus]|uniref:Glutamate--tRNA ligase n=1 Tax=Phaeovibrio sulfidiphilus TaxID=1220600 RepID=A0A8J6YQN4_9PROT|nr:glutamate--tRNA ligase [Phaeovibrio sulfidiphilus]MBE1237567.1 glutamate--tRNA ligase [Phaeovibrio sulfidiphilus]
MNTLTTPTPGVRVRFAPSPTGELHLGNARIAIINALFSRAHGGEFILRLDDTDAERSTDAFAHGIRDDLAWLGLTWSREERQSDREPLYREALAQLEAAGRLYPCFETPEELEAHRTWRRARGQPPVYNRETRRLTDEIQARAESGTHAPHWRFALEPRDIVWDDLVRGRCHYNGAHLSDPVLVRADGLFLYTLPSVVDDLEMGITHVIRGEDHVVNTAVQLQLIEALGGVAPAWAHLPLVLSADGGPLSKREGSLSLSGLRAEGIQPEAITALMAALGGSGAPEPGLSLDELARDFRLEAFGRAPPRLDPEDLPRLSARVIHTLPWETARARGVTLTEQAWPVVRPNLERLDEARAWERVLDGPLDPVTEDGDREFLDQAVSCLPASPWDRTTWKTWTDALKALSGRKGRPLFLPLRRALTGTDHGPDMNDLLPLLDPGRVQARLKGNTA